MTLYQSLTLLTFTTYIKGNLKSGSKTATAFINLIVVYDTVCSKGLFFKFLRIIYCGILSNFLNNKRV